MSTAVIVILLVISISLNVIFVWYIRKLMQEFTYMSDNVEKTAGVLSTFTEHLEKLYELETYYGDESLKSLIEHSKQVLEDIKGFETVISSLSEDTGETSFDTEEELDEKDQ